MRSDLDPHLQRRDHARRLPGNYSVTRTWTATDDCGNFSTASQTITVRTSPAPVIAALPGADDDRLPGHAELRPSDGHGHLRPERRP